jgi:cytochrome c oxidase subunit IV
MTTNNFSKAIQTGWIVMSILFILTIIEFSVAIFLEGKLQIIGLFISGLLKAGLILQTFMHFGQLWENISNLWWGVVLTFEEKDEK